MYCSAIKENSHPKPLHRISQQPKSMEMLAILIIPVGLGAVGFMLGSYLRSGSICKGFPYPNTNREHDGQSVGEIAVASDAVV